MADYAAHKQTSQNGPRLIFSLLSALVFGGVLYGLANTKIGVHVVFSALGIGTYDDLRNVDRTDAPVDARTISATHPPIALPESVLQPSGLSWDANLGQFALVTDQADLFALSPDLTESNSHTLIQGGPLIWRQGHTETVAMQGGQVFVAGDHGEIKRWVLTDGTWSEGDAISYGASLIVTGDISGMAVDRDLSRLFFIDESPFIKVLDLASGEQSQFQLTGRTKSGRSLQEYTFTGLSFENGLLYAISSYHHNVVAVDPNTSQVQQAWALQDIFDPSGLAVREGKAYVTVDHEYTEPSPGIQVFELN